ncbi:hypothetical protein [Thermaurantimonas aggregans]|uniref:hypothetical protein n=1 Tax=Thermaurantimonas aggregans TaxID=2173829 RepID=UPI000F56654F|nr:hypothetical protein [Thermaurantimonas aggregans]MCX8149721.1 hypothetical protein [Thermaurantimonas aggregans]
MKHLSLFIFILVFSSLLSLQKGLATNHPEKVRITLTRNYYSKNRSTIFSVSAGNQITLQHPDEPNNRLYFSVSRSRYITEDGIEGIVFEVEPNSYDIKGFYLFELPNLTTTRNGVKVSIDGYNLLIIVDKNGIAEYFYASF